MTNDDSIYSEFNRQTDDQLACWVVVLNSNCELNSLTDYQKSVLERAKLVIRHFRALLNQKNEESEDNLEKTKQALKLHDESQLDCWTEEMLNALMIRWVKKVLINKESEKQ